MLGTQHTCCFKTVCALYMCVFQNDEERLRAPSGLIRSIPSKATQNKNGSHKQDNIEGNAKEQKASVGNDAPAIPDE